MDGVERPLSFIAELMLAQTAVALTLTLHTNLVIDLKGCSPLVQCLTACVAFPLVAVEGVLYLRMLGCFAGDRNEPIPTNRDPEARADCVREVQGTGEATEHLE